MSNIPSLTLNTNASMPLLGLGVYKATAPGGSVLLLFHGKNFLSQQNYGIPHSESEILTGPFNEVWIDSDLIMWIFI